LKKEKKKEVKAGASRLISWHFHFTPEPARD
jgi:hypothetical protein